MQLREQSSFPWPVILGARCIGSADKIVWTTEAVRSIILDSTGRV
jgi:hypothetical protein